MHQTDDLGNMHSHINDVPEYLKVGHQNPLHQPTTLA